MKSLKLVIPKGRMFKAVSGLLTDIGIRFEGVDRLYLPSSNDRDLEIKIMKPQNVAQLIALGSHDIGFTGLDWLVETSADVREVMDLKLDPVRLVAAVPRGCTSDDLANRRVIVASEYERISRRFLRKQGYRYLFIRTYGATEAFPPHDADMIIDNSASGRTLKEHRLKIIATILHSSTRFIANKRALEDSWKGQKIAEMKMLFSAVMNARSRVMLEMNVPRDRLESVVAILPCMRAPTVAPLHRTTGYAVKVAVERNRTRSLIPRLKELGATDILEYSVEKVIV